MCSHRKCLILYSNEKCLTLYFQDNPSVIQDPTSVRKPASINLVHFPNFYSSLIPQSIYSFLSLYYIACESIQVHVQPQPYFPVNPVIPNWQNHIMQPGASLVALAVKKQPANAGDMWHVGLIPGSGRSPGGGHDNPLPYSCLENPMDRGAWQATVHRVSESRIWLKWLGMHIPFYRGNDYSWWKMFFIEFQLINEEEMICDHWSKC